MKLQFYTQTVHHHFGFVGKYCCMFLVGENLGRFVNLNIDRCTFRCISFAKHKMDLKLFEDLLYILFKIVLYLLDCYF